MKKDKQDLYKVIIPLLKSINSDKKVVNRICDYMFSKNVNYGRALSILNGNTSITLTSLEELILLTIGLYKATEIEKIDPYIYFQDHEIEVAEHYFTQKKEDLLVIEITNVDQVNRFTWRTNAMSIVKISELHGAGLLDYNYRTQRPPTLIEVDDTLVEMASINQTSVEEIAKEMDEGIYFPDTITWNIRITGQEKYEYDSKKRILYISTDKETTYCDILDGAHRITAGYIATRKNQNIELYFPLEIVHLNEKDARRYIAQRGKQNKIKEETLIRFNSENENVILSELINDTGSSKTNEMFKKLAENSLETNPNLKDYDKYTTFEIINKTLDYFRSDKTSDYGLKTESVIDSEMIVDSIIKGFNYIIGLNKNEFKNRQESQENLYITSKNMFIVHLSLIILLRQRENYIDELKEMLNKIDFSKDNSKWEDLGINNETINKSFIKKFVKYVQELVS